MKRIIVLLSLVVTLGIPEIVMAGIIAPARVLLVGGDVMMRSPAGDEWLPVSVNTPLDEGDALWTPAGGISEVQLSNGTIVRVDGGSLLDLIAVEDGFTHLHLSSGRLYLRTSNNAASNSLQIDADDTTILPDARTRLRIDMLPNSEEDVSIFKGSAYVEGNGARTKVRTGEHIALEEGHSELLPLNPPDNWEEWNRERDRNQSRSVSAESNLPDELSPYSGELETNGTWVYSAEYGMVWRPTALASEEWAPYRNGRWIWKGNDYVWISNENWGWLPYHFGRWAFFSGFGWCWVPPIHGDVYWGPGFVGWYQSGDHVGWTPLAPGEVYYGHGQYGYHSINIKDSPAHSTAVPYKNRNAHGGLTILLQSDFLIGRAVFQKPTNSAAISASVSLGAPRILPIRETRMPVVRQQPPAAIPPAVPNRDSRELRTRFPRLSREVVKQRSIPPRNVETVPYEKAMTATSPAASIVHRNEGENVHTSPQQKVLNHPEQKIQSPVARSDNHLSPANVIRHEDTLKPLNKPEKKVWKVTTTEQVNEKNQKENDGREHKGKK